MYYEVLRRWDILRHQKGIVQRTLSGCVGWVNAASRFLEQTTPPPQLEVSVSLWDKFIPE